MNRKAFLQNLGWIAGGTIISSFAPFRKLLEKPRKVKGVVLSKGKAVPNVVISDGYSVVTTNRKGKYEFEPHPESAAVFISTPSGYAFENEMGICRHYQLLEEGHDEREINFHLVPLDKDDNEHQFFIWADPQVKNQKDVDRMMNESVPDMQKLISAAGSGALLHGITVGDIVWDEHKYFPHYNKAVEQMGIPFFQCLGNHDMDYNQGGDERSDDTFQKTYGPTYYSFNRGEVHYVVMDNVRYLGVDRKYDGFITQNQLDWLAKDLSFVPLEKLVVLCLHIPVHRHTKNNTDLYTLLAGRKVHIMSGHTHYHQNIVHDNIFEHNHGTVCGAWWTGAICEDGTPNGYGVYKVNGTGLSWHYQSTGQPMDHQMKAYVSNEDPNNKMLQVNIWNYDPEWKTEYWIDGVSGGSLEQFEGMDPFAISTLKGPELPKPRGFAEPKKTKHLFKAQLPASAKEVKILATDRFGKTYSTTQNV